MWENNRGHRDCGISAGAYGKFPGAGVC